MSLKKRWSKAGKVEYDDHDTAVVFDQYGNRVRVKRWLQLARFVKGGKQSK